MKKMIALCLTLVLFFSAGPHRVHATENIRLSSLSNAEILDFLEERNIAVPDGYAESDAALAEQVRYWIEIVESNPNVTFNYNFTDSYYFSNAVKDAVNDYYNYTPIAGGISTFAAYTLQQSTLWSIPSNPSQFNCYAYALKRSDDWYNPGYFSGYSYTQTELNALTVVDLAAYVVDDLRSSSYSYCTFDATTVRPAYEDLVSGQTAICIRKGQDDEGNADYHLARLFYETEDEYGDAWRHKPGESYILQYISYPSSGVAWVSEGYISSGAYQSTDGLEYTGTIYYIIYGNSCNYGTSILIHDYHEGTTHYYQYSHTCSVCNVTKTYTESEYCNGTACGDHDIYPYVNGG